jgi:hypothetical protein
MGKDHENGEELDALCRECGYAFKVYVDRLTAKETSRPTADTKAECPVCGCGECRIGH